MGISQDGDLNYRRGFGWRDREAGLPATPDTVCGLASLTKSFAAVAILQLMEQGRLSVDDPVVRYLPRFRTPDPLHTRAITLYHLLTHSAGLPLSSLLHRGMAESLNPDDEPAPGSAIRAGGDLLAAIADKDMHYGAAPGERHSYSAIRLFGCSAVRMKATPFSASSWRPLPTCPSRSISRPTGGAPSA